MATNSAKAKVKRDQHAETERWERRHRAQSFIQGKELDELEMEVETGLYENVDLSHGSGIPIITAHVLFSKYILYGFFQSKGMLRLLSLFCRLFMVECF